MIRERIQSLDEQRSIVGDAQPRSVYTSHELMQCPAHYRTVVRKNNKLGKYKQSLYAPESCRRRAPGVDLSSLWRESFWSKLCSWQAASVRVVVSTPQDCACGNRRNNDRPQPFQRRRLSTITNKEMTAGHFLLCNDGSEKNPSNLCPPRDNQLRADWRIDGLRVTLVLLIFHSFWRLIEGRISSGPAVFRGAVYRSRSGSQVQPWRSKKIEQKSTRHDCNSRPHVDELGAASGVRKIDALKTGIKFMQLSFENSII